MELREKISRIIHPDLWRSFDNSYKVSLLMSREIIKSMAAADRLIAAFPSLNQDNQND